MTTESSTRTATASLAVENCFIYIDDTEAALGFYRDILGFTVTNDVTAGDFRWVTLTTPTQPELQITLQTVGVGGTDEDRDAMADLMAKGLLGGLNFSCDDVDAVFEHIRAAGGEVLQEPMDQFYGVRDCAFRDPAGNLVRVNSVLDAG